MSNYQKNIIWLASYPKSGNTWVRIFLKNFIEEDVGIETEFPSLQALPIASNRNILDRSLGLSSSNLTTEEINNFRPAVYRQISTNNKGLQVLKVHDSFGKNSMGEIIFPEEISQAAVYIVRNPLDIVVSYSYHSNKPVQTIIDQLNDSSFEISKSDNGLKPQIQQHIGTWSEHVASWTEQKHIPVIFITFEKLLENSTQVFRKLLEQLGLPYNKNTFNMALDLCDFSNLKKLESRYGFREKPISSNAFFREGKRNGYLTHLSKKQIDEITESHSYMMSKLGYLETSP